MIAMPSSSTAMMKVSRNWPKRHHRPISGDRCDRRWSSVRRCEPRFAGRCEADAASPVRLRTCARQSIGSGTSPPIRVGSGNVVGCGWPDPGGAELQLGRGAATERVAERPPDHLVDERLVAEPDLRLRRMHVDVHRVERHLDEEMHLRTALLDRRDAVGVDDRVGDRPILDDAAVDEDVLRPARRPLLGQRRDVSDDLHVAAFAPHLDQVVALAVQLIQAIAQRRPPAGTAAPCARRWSA